MWQLDLAYQQVLQMLFLPGQPYCEKSHLCWNLSKLALQNQQFHIQFPSGLGGRGTRLSIGCSSVCLVPSTASVYICLIGNTGTDTANFDRLQMLLFSLAGAQKEDEKDERSSFGFSFFLTPSRGSATYLTLNTHFSSTITYC